MPKSTFIPRTDHDFLAWMVLLSPRLSHKKLTCLSIEIRDSGESVNFSILA